MPLNTEIRKWLAAPVGGVLVLLIISAVFLGRELLRQVDGLSTAEADNVQWNLSQGEVEHLRLEGAVNAVPQGGSLSEVRRRFDVFFSRIAIYQESHLYQGVRQDPVTGPLLRDIQASMDTLVPLIDGPDEILRKTVPKMQELLAEQATDVRRLLIAGIAVHTQETEVRRNALRLILVRLGWVLVFLVGALIAGANVLWLLNRRAKQLAKESAESAARMEAMVSSSLDAILMVDTEGFIRGFNGAAETIFGYTQAEAIGRPMAELIIPEQFRTAKKTGLPRFSNAAARPGTGKGRIRLQALHKTGRVFPVELSIKPSTSGGDTVFVSFLRDITEQLEAEEELRRARDDALAGEKAKANLLTVMSHEMRTPLNGVLGAINLLDDTGITKDQRRYLDAMRVSGDLLLSHVNDVLELSRLEAGITAEEVRVFDLAALVSGLGESQQASAARRGNQIQIDISLGREHHALGDPLQVQRVLLNLLGNALKFTRGGIITISVSRQGDLVEFSVADTGVGIESDDLERIFDEFITLDASYARQSEGTGLGLSISRRIVRAMGGEIGAESEPGEGSLFWFTVSLPAAPPETERSSSPPALGDVGRRILIVEDNEINRLLLVKVLEKHGHEVTSACGGEESVQIVGGQRFDLILMDISMPGMDGIEAVSRIRRGRLAENTPIVALTAHAAAEDRQRILRAGFAEVLTKPVSQKDLATAIRDYTGTSHANADQTAEGIRAVFDGLGSDRAAYYLNRFQREYLMLRAGVNSGSSPDKALRAEAHRLAGSASILGLKPLQNCLSALESADDSPVDVAALDAAWEQAETVITAALEI